MLISILLSLFAGVAIEETVEILDLEKYQGRWYQIYGNDFDQLFEKFSSCITADYTLVPDGNVTVLNSQYEKYKGIEHRFIAHCIDSMPKQTFASQVKTQTETVILIGPEGDFRQDEVELAIENGYKTVSLGQQRLRTETAAISACSFFNLLNDEGM
jgi:16S rRNA (uracil1498-N3)-methyltransferase